MVCTSCAWKTPCYHCACASASPESERMPWYSHAVCCITNPSFQMPEQQKKHTQQSPYHRVASKERDLQDIKFYYFSVDHFICVCSVVRVAGLGRCTRGRLYHSIATMWCLCERDLCKVFALRDRIHILRFCLCLFTLSRAHTQSQSACGSATTDRYVPKQYNRCILSEIKTPAIEWPTIGQQPVWRYEYEVYIHLGGIVRSSVEKWDATKMTDPDS